MGQREWTGREQQSQQQQQQQQQQQHQQQQHQYQSSGPHIGIYGWRKRCLYLLILALLITVIVNLALTLWVIKIMELNANGMGDLRIVSGGVELTGEAYVMKSLVASSIRSRIGQPITVDSAYNFTVNTRDNEGHITNSIHLGKDTMDCYASAFRVSDKRGRILFSAENNRVVVGAEELHVTGDGGAVFKENVQTPLVRAGVGSSLTLESPTRGLKVHSSGGISMESRAGDISASCLTDLKLQSIAGAIKLEAASVFLPHLKTARGSPYPPKSRASYSMTPSRIYQLCVCSNGKLFLSPADGYCATDNEDILCR